MLRKESGTIQNVQLKPQKAKKKKEWKTKLGAKNQGQQIENINEYGRY